MSLYVFVLLSVLLVESTEAIKCYACSYTYTGTDVSAECIHAPWNVTQGGRETMCGDNQFCTIHRLYDTGRKIMLSFARMCELNTGTKEGCTKDAYGRVSCFLMCREDLCNDSDGIQRPSTQDGSDSTSRRTKPGHLPKWLDAWNHGKDNGANAVSSSSLVCVLLLLCWHLCG